MTKPVGKEHPILFNAEMVRAVLDGRKTQTRRVVKPQPGPNDEVRNGVINIVGMTNAAKNYNAKTGYCEWDGSGHATVTPMKAHMLREGETPNDNVTSTVIKCPFGQPGDRLWVRETWRIASAQAFEEGIEEVAFKDGTRKCLNDEEEEIASEYAGLRAWKQWMPSIHMPRWASRITLEIVDVRVERVQEISEEDAYAEGVRGEFCKTFAETGQWPDGSECEDCDGEGRFSCYYGFKKLWNTIYKNWIDNPWVWVVTFRRIKP